MGGSSTFGIEMNDGTIQYCVYGDYALLEIILPVFQQGNVYQIQDEDGELMTADSLEDYFSETRYEEEDSKVRGVYKLNGTFMYKFWGDTGHFVYHKLNKNHGFKVTSEM
jgi:hypothetical protein